MRLRAILLSAVVAWFPGAARTADESSRLLLIAIDGIPYDLAAQLASPEPGQPALFAGLHGPAALINAFPSNSYTTWTGILAFSGAELPLGYEARYYDIEQNKLRGGLTPIPVPAPWRDFFDWHLEGVFRKAVAYGWPQTYSLRELRSGLEAFLQSDSPVFRIYVVSTDGVGHIRGPDGLGEVLRRMDAELRAFREKHPEEKFYTVLFSDHGMAGGEPLENIWFPVRAAIARAGLRASDTLEEQNDAVLLSFGLLTSFVIYVREDAAASLADEVARAKGVDLCITAGRDAWTVHGPEGRAEIRRRKNEQQGLWSYRPITADPLDYETVLRRLEERSRLDRGGWYPDGWWFEATKWHVYPDALYRIARAFDLSANPAQVICSVAPGYMFGARLTEYVARLTIGPLKWTHGALHREATNGFLMTDLPSWRALDAVRFDEALDFFAPWLPVRAGVTPAELSAETRQ